MEDFLVRSVPVDIKEAGEENVSRFIASTDDEDLAGDTINPKGWVFENKTQIPFLWGHLSREPPIGRIKKTFVEGNKLICDVLWAVKNARAAELYELMKDGFISACSVGFWPLEYKERFDDKNRFLGFEFVKQRLLELSLVNIPANAKAVVVQRSAEDIAAELKLLRSGGAIELKEPASGLITTPLRNAARLKLARAQSTGADAGAGH